MPVVSLEEMRASDALVRAPRDRVATAPVETRRLPFGMIFDAAMQIDNPIAGAGRLAGQMFQEAIEPYPIDPDFDPFKDPRIDALGPEMAEVFVGVRSAQEFEAVYNNARRELSNRGIVAEAGAMGFGATMLAATLSPTTLLPLGFFKTGMTAGKAALSGAATIGGATAVEEMILQGASEIRTLQESGLIVGTASIIGAVLAPVLSRGQRAGAGRSSRIFIDRPEIKVSEYARKMDEELDLQSADRRPRRPARKGVHQEMADQARRNEEARGDIAAEDGRIIDPDEPVSPRTLGAAAVDETPIRYRDRLNDEAMVVTHLLLERMPDNPFKRMLMSTDLFVREITTRLAETPGILQNKHFSGGKAVPSVEREFKRIWLPRLVGAIKQVDAIYANVYRRDVPPPTGSGSLDKTRDLTGRPPADASKIDMLQMGVRDFFTKTDAQGHLPDGKLTYLEFRRQVGIALRNGDEHAIPEVQQAAEIWRREIFKPALDEGMEHGLFSIELRRRLDQVNEDILEAQARGGRKRAENLDIERQRLEAEITRLDKDGPTLETATSYFPRMWRHDVLQAREIEFKQIVMDYLETKRIPAKELHHLADEIFERILQERPYVRIDDAIRDTRVARGGRARSFEIPDHMVEDFLESDVEAVGRFYTRTVGTDIQLLKEFESLDLAKEIEEITANAEALRGATSDPIKRKAIMKQFRQDVEDLRAMRDRLRGTYGLPDDPYRTVSRIYRTAKQWAYLTMLGGVFLSQLPDIARPIMTEGVERTFRAGLVPLFKKNAFIKLSRKEAGKAGTALDMELGTRALAFAEIGDIFGHRTAFERSLTTSSGIFSIANLLNPWNAMIKGWVGTIVSDRILEQAMKVRRHRLQLRAANLEVEKVSSKIQRNERGKLGRSGLDDDDLEAIAIQFERYGQTEEGVRLPNTELWDSEGLAALARFRNALGADVDRIIVTPGVADRPLWASTELGSVVAQFKSFAMSANNRVLMAALQERDMAALQGTAMLIGMGAVVDSLKRAQFGDDRDQEFGEQLLGAVDRSGILGYFTDANRALETMTDYRVGLGPLINGARPYDASFRSKLGTIAGPTGSMFANIMDIMGDTLSGEMDRFTARKIRSLIPLQNHLVFRGIFDAAEQVI